MKDFDCTVIGDVAFDILYRIPASPAPYIKGGTTYYEHAKAVPGGAGNVAAGVAILGGRAAFVGKAGNDFFGALYLRDLKKRGVVPFVFVSQESPTGLVTIFTNEAERSFLVSRGANDQLSPQEIRKAISPIQKSQYVYISGYSLVNDPQRSAILRATELARKFKTKIVFDPGAHNLIKSNQELFVDLLNSCDVLCLNLDEAVAITGLEIPDDVINELRKKAPLVALKCGEKGSILVTRKQIIKTTAFETNSVDPTGAGDSFAAALIYGLARGLRLKAAGRLANWFASHALTDFGARNFPERCAIDAFLKEFSGREKTSR